MDDYRDTVTITLRDHALTFTSVNDALDYVTLDAAVRLAYGHYTTLANELAMEWDIRQSTLITRSKERG